MKLSPTRIINLRKLGEARGFALISIIPILVLLSLVAIGLLSLSTISIRTSTNLDGQAQARANARLALMLAIGDLQKHLGPDRRISAHASLIHPGARQPNIVGAWESWKHEPEVDSSAAYNKKNEKFLGWLASTRSTEEASDIRFPTQEPSQPIWLIKPSATGGSTSSASAEGLQANILNYDAGRNRRAGLAYAVMDESIKAPIDLPDLEPRNREEQLAHFTAPPRAQPEMLIPGLAPDSIGDPQRLITLLTAGIPVGPEQIEAYQWDLTTQSLSLLTDVVRGGYKMDLTTLLEGARERPDYDELFGRETLYFEPEDGGLMWAYLKDTYMKYAQILDAGSSTPRFVHDRRTLRAVRDNHRSLEAMMVYPDEQRLMPVITKLQIVFSIVTHYCHIADRVNFYNTESPEKDNEAYAAPHLVYEPVVHIYNPYNVALTMDSLRIRVWDPPVVFRFRKNNAWIRSDFARGQFHSLGMFQIANDNNPEARKEFTMHLTEARSGNRPGGKITLEPGEVRIFSPYVEPNWTWQLEAGSGYDPRAFFDWNAGLDFGNIDGRSNNPYGVDTIPGWDDRAGLQTDHLSQAGGRRPANSLYDFERDAMAGSGWMVVRLRDRFTVEAKAGRPEGASRDEFDFRVDLLAGTSRGSRGSPAPADNDILRSYRFRFQDVEREITADAAAGEPVPTIERTASARNLLQEPRDRTAGGKTPFAMLTMRAKTTNDYFDVSKPWAFHHLGAEGGFQDTRVVGNALDTYDLRFEEITDVSNQIQWDSATNRSFYGASEYVEQGSTAVPMFRVPMQPAASLGDLIPTNLNPAAATAKFTHPLGSSWAHPVIGTRSAVRKLSGSANQLDGHSGLQLDHAYLLNNALWDHTFFSCAASFESNGLSLATNRKDLLTAFLKGEEGLLNPRLVPLTPTVGSAEEQANTLDGLSLEDLTRKMAGSMAIRGGFNVNSDSAAAWRAVLTSLRDADVMGWQGKEYASNNNTPFPRLGMPIVSHDNSDRAFPTALRDEPQRWAGYRALTDNQIEELAEAIVEQLRLRAQEDEAPNLSLAEFVNRRLGRSGDIQTLAGLLETAIEQAGINEFDHSLDSREVGPINDTFSFNDLNGEVEPTARYGYTAEGAPTILNQKDLLMPLASFITVRGDTFRIRAYGESQSKAGGPKSQAWCEAVVQRLPEYLDATADEPEIAEADLASDINRTFGRRFVVTGFRWLAPEEI